MSWMCAARPACSWTAHRTHTSSGKLLLRLPEAVRRSCQASSSHLGSRLLPGSNPITLTCSNQGRLDSACFFDTKREKEAEGERGRAGDIGKTISEKLQVQLPCCSLCVVLQASTGQGSWRERALSLSKISWSSRGRPSTTPQASWTLLTHTAWTRVYMASRCVLRV